MNGFVDYIRRLGWVLTLMGICIVLGILVADKGLQQWYQVLYEQHPDFVWGIVILIVGIALRLWADRR